MTNVTVEYLISKIFTTDLIPLTAPKYKKSFAGYVLTNNDACFHQPEIGCYSISIKNL